MAKSDASLEEVDISPTDKNPRKPKWGKERTINGLDTETANGRVFLITQSFGENQETRHIHNYPHPLNKSQIWKGLTHEKMRGNVNVWFNMTFDIETLLSEILTDKQNHKLRVTNQLEIDGYELLYIPGKLFFIEDSNNHNYRHFDASQFCFGQSLENASDELLDKTKKDEDIDVTKFGMSDTGTVNKYIQDNFSEIVEYGKIDAELVRQIYEKLVRIGENDLDYQIPMGMPISTGSLAEQFMEKHFRKPGFGINSVQEYAWETYQGGRFEALKRGNVGKVVVPDINSAYPDKLRKLPDPISLRWKKIENPTFEDLRESDYGFVRGTFTTDKRKPIQPFAVKQDGRVTFPALKKKELTVIKDLFLDSLEMDLISSYSLDEAWLGYEIKSTRYPFQKITELYEKRYQYKDSGKYISEMLLKIVMNSMYGKFCQTTEKKTKVEKTIDTSKTKNRFISLVDTIMGMLRPEVFPNGIKVKLESGRWFNPFLATYITGLTRNQLIKTVYDYGLENDTVLLATDSVMIEKEAFDSTNFTELIEPRTLGKWDYDVKEGKAFIVGNGVYEIEKPDGSKKLGNRGFRELTELTDLIRDTEGDIMIPNERPLKLGDIDTTIDRTLEQVGMFVKDERKLDPNMDNKRDWNRQDDFNSLLSEKTESKPLVI